MHPSLQVESFVFHYNISCIMRFLRWFSSSRASHPPGQERSTSSSILFWFDTKYFYRFLLYRSSPLINNIIYFLSISIIGFLVLKLLRVRNLSEKPRNIDFFFTSVSAATVSSMSTVEMEVFSNSQLIVLTILMLIGGEVFTSVLALYFRKDQIRLKGTGQVAYGAEADEIELQPAVIGNLDAIESGIGITMPLPSRSRSSNSNDLKYNAIGSLANLTLAFLVVALVCGSLSVLVYFYVVSSARDVLKQKGLHMLTFSVFTTVSTFSSCGFVPTNENMIVFSKDLGLLLLLIPQVLAGNTLFPVCLRMLIWILKRMTRRVELGYLLENSGRIKFYHLFSGLYTFRLAITVLAFLAIQLVLICSMHWHTAAFSGMNSFQKLVNALFLSVNSRHTGESTVNLSVLSSAVLVLFVLMMYLPPYTAYMPSPDDDENTPTNENKPMSLLDSFVFSQLSYLTIFIILICITERKQLADDPVNFNVLNIAIEVVSAYGNVGYSAGYSCSLRRNQVGSCKDYWFGFAGKWSDLGKCILIIVMFFGRMKKFNMHGGKAWKLN